MTLGNLELNFCQTFGQLYSSISVKAYEKFRSSLAEVILTLAYTWPKLDSTLTTKICKVSNPKFGSSLGQTSTYSEIWAKFGPNLIIFTRLKFQNPYLGQTSTCAESRSTSRYFPGKYFPKTVICFSEYAKRLFLRLGKCYHFNPLLFFLSVHRTHESRPFLPSEKRCTRAACCMMLKIGSFCSCSYNFPFTSHVFLVHTIVYRRLRV